MADHLPVPAAGETERDFLIRGMEDEVAVRLFKDEKIRLAALAGEFAEPSNHGDQSSGGGRRFTASALPDGGEDNPEREAINAFMSDDAMIAKYPDHWHRYDMAIENLKTVRREVQAARGCQPWEE